MTNPPYTRFDNSSVLSAREARTLLDVIEYFHVVGRR